MIRLIRICEDRMHAMLVEGIAERVVAEFTARGWPFDAWELVDETSKAPITRRWCTLDGRDGHESSTALPKRPFGKGGAKAEGIVARKAVLYGLAALSERGIAADEAVIFVVVDLHTASADVSAALGSMCDAVDDALRNEPRPPCVVCVAMAPEAEAWVCAGFLATNDQETAALDALRQRVSFDPTTQPHRLTGGTKTEPNDAKRALRELVADKYSPRAQRCWSDTALDVLARNGQHAGVPQFLNALRNFMVPSLLKTRPSTDRGGRT